MAATALLKWCSYSNLACYFIWNKRKAKTDIQWHAAARQHTGKKQNKVGFQCGLVKRFCLIKSLTGIPTAERRPEGPTRKALAEGIQGLLGNWTVSKPQSVTNSEAKSLPFMALVCPRSDFREQHSSLISKQTCQLEWHFPKKYMGQRKFFQKMLFTSAPLLTVLILELGTIQHGHTHRV